jgi:hypothetical protein
MQALLGAFDSRCALGPLVRHLPVRRSASLRRGRRPIFARVPFGKTCALNGRSSSGQGPEDRKDNNMIAVALVIAWLAVVGLVLIARGDYRQRRPIR